MNNTWNPLLEALDILKGLGTLVPAQGTYQATNWVLRNFTPAALLPDRRGKARGMSDFRDPRMQANLKALEHAMRSYVPPGLLFSAALAKEQEEQFPGSCCMAIGDGTNDEVLTAVIVAAWTRIIGRFKVFATYDGLEEALPKVNALLVHPTNRYFIANIGYELGVTDRPFKCLDPFYSTDALLRFFAQHGVEVLAPTDVHCGMNGWDGLKFALVERFEERARRDKPRAEWEKEACKLLRTPNGFSIAAATTGWRNTTHSLGGKELKTEQVITLMKKLVLHRGYEMASYGVLHQLAEGPPTLLLGDPGVETDPSVDLRVRLMLMFAQMLQDVLIVRHSLGEKLSDVEQEWVFPLSFSTVSARKELLHGQRIVAERAHEIWHNMQLHGHIMVAPHESQWDALRWRVAGNKLRPDQGGGRGAAVVGAFLEQMNLLLKTLEENPMAGVGGGPFPVELDPHDPLYYATFPEIDLSRMDRFRRILTAMVEARARPIIRERAMTWRRNHPEETLKLAA